MFSSNDMTQLTPEKKTRYFCVFLLLKGAVSLIQVESGKRLYDLYAAFKGRNLSSWGGGDSNTPFNISFC